MAAFSDYAEQKILETLLNNAAFPTISSTWVSLHTAATTDAGGGTEVSGVSYARVDCGAFTSMTAITDGQTENSAEIAFAQAGAGGWGLVTHVALWDASTAGNMLLHGILTASKQIDENDTFKFAIGDLVITVD